MKTYVQVPSDFTEKPARHMATPLLPEAEKLVELGDDNFAQDRLETVPT